MTELRSISIRPTVLVFGDMCVCVCLCIDIYLDLGKRMFLVLLSFWKICPDFYEMELIGTLTEIPFCAMEECRKFRA